MVKLSPFLLNLLFLTAVFLNVSGQDIILQQSNESGIYKKGETIETLDVKIADELGTRNYEMYSGGEAFRIDIAIRIALSKLLVRRAGASLSTLIID